MKKIKRLFAILQKRFKKKILKKYKASLFNVNIKSLRRFSYIKKIAIQIVIIKFHNSYDFVFKILLLKVCKYNYDFI